MVNATNTAIETLRTNASIRRAVRKDGGRYDATAQDMIRLTAELGREPRIAEVMAFEAAVEAGA